MKNSKSRKTKFHDFTDTCLTEVNTVIDDDGFTIVRKAIIRCVLAQNTSIYQEIPQLLQYLQDIIQLYPIEFAGYAV